MIETTTSEAVLARLEALEARIADLEAENARLTAALASPAAAVPPPPAAEISRRGMLARVLGATAAAALLAVAKDAPTAHADARGTLIAGSVSTLQYGLVARAVPGLDPNDFLPTNLGPTSHGLLGVDFTYTGTIPYFSGVLGATGAADAAGVQGLNTNGPGVYG